MPARFAGAVLALDFGTAAAPAPAPCPGLEATVRLVPAGALGATRLRSIAGLWQQKQNLPVLEPNPTEPSMGMTLPILCQSVNAVALRNCSADENPS